MESELQVMESLLGKYSIRSASLKMDIESYKSNASRGQYINTSSYNEAISNYNKLVEQYNSVLKQHQIKYAGYETELKRINDLIDRYNCGN